MEPQYSNQLVESNHLGDIMTSPPPQTRKVERRLLEIAREEGVPTVQKPVLPLRARRKGTRASPEDKVRAELYILQLSSTTTGNRLSVDEDSIFNPKTINQALATAVAENVSADTIESLLNFGGNVNVLRQASHSRWKKMMNQDQEDQRNHVLEVATRNGNLPIVQLLAERADQVALDAALPWALRTRSPNKYQITRVLLEYGANSEPLHEDFKAAVRNRDEDMVELLLGASRPPCMGCRVSSLRLALENGSLRSTSTLVFGGAAASDEQLQAACSELAVKSGRLGLLVAMVISPTGLSAKVLDGVLTSPVGHLPPQRRLRFIEVCLLEGAKGGKNCSEALVDAVRQRELALSRLLIDHGASIDHRDGAALRHAIETKQTALIERMLQVRVMPSTLTAVVRATWGALLSDLNFADYLMERLVIAGATGDISAEFLCAVLDQTKHGGLEHRLELLNPPAYKLARRLLDNGHADVNHKRGRLLQIALRGSLLDVVQLLLARKPSRDSLNAALPFATRARHDHPKRLEVVRSLLDSGAHGEVLNEELIYASQAGRDGLPLVDVLLKRASVDFRDGQAIRHAIQHRSVELLLLLLTARPSTAALQHIRAEATNLQDERYQTQIFGFLDRAARGNFVDRALIEAAISFNLEDVYCIAGANTPPDTFSLALEAVMQTEDRWLSSDGLSVIQLLLEGGASPAPVCAALVRAAGLFHRDAVFLLASQVDDRQIFTMAFNEAANGTQWLSEEGLELLDFFLEKGVGREYLHMALVQALDSSMTASAPEILIDLLLHYGADVNYADGDPVSVAALYGDLELINKLLRYEPTPRSLSQGLVSAVRIQHEEPRFMALLETLMHSTEARRDINYVTPGMDPLLFLALHCYPQSTMVIKALCNAGVDVDARVHCCVYDDEDLEPEIVPVLHWSLLQPGDPISDEVINILIDAGANVNAVLDRSKATPLLLAAKYNRPNVIRRLLKEGAKVTHKDTFDRSAMFYAAQHQDTTALAYLLKAKPPSDDGSLHEAARELNAEAVRLLIKTGHDPNFTSTKHEGRTALAELCLRCPRPRDTVVLEETLENLKKGKADPMKKWQGKTAMFLALDHIDPVPVVDKLMERLMWKYINHSDNIYAEGDYFYSPTMYIKKGVLKGPGDQCNRVLRLLNYHSAVDRYYAGERLEQPKDMIGEPDNIKEFERKRLIRVERLRNEQEDHQRHLDRAAEEARHKALRDQMRHEKQMREREEVAQQRYRHRQIDHVQALGQSQEKHDQTVGHKQQMHDLAYGHRQATHNQALGQKQDQLIQKQHEVKQSHQLAMDLQWEKEQRREYIEQRKREEKLRHERNEYQQKMSNLNQEQRMRLHHSKNVDKQKLRTQYQQNQLRAVAKLKDNQLTASDRRDQVVTAKAKNRAQIGYKKDVAKVQAYEHEMRMAEMFAKRENLQMQMIQSRFNKEQRVLAQGNRKRLMEG